MLLPPVLIETLWNVKSYQGQPWCACFVSINRNIVECKVFDDPQAVASDFVLIETLWNVKFQIGVVDRKVQRSINRNIVECKVL